MSALRNNLRTEFQNEEYRYSYAESHLETTLAAQVKVLREQRGMTQTQLAGATNTKQGAISRIESCAAPNLKLSTLWGLARALGVRVRVSFETFGSLVEEKENFRRAHLQRPDFTSDPFFVSGASGHLAPGWSQGQANPVVSDGGRVGATLSLPVPLHAVGADGGGPLFLRRKPWNVAKPGAVGSVWLPGINPADVTGVLSNEQRT